MPFRRQLELAQLNGFQGVDLGANQLAGAYASKTVRRLAGDLKFHNLRPGGWMLPFDFIARTSFNTESMRLLDRAARAAAMLDSPWCYYWIEPASDDLSFAANAELHVQRIRPVADVLGAHGCKLALEPIGPLTLRRGHLHEFVHDIPEALELLDAVARPNVCLLVDSFHWYTSHGDVGQLKHLTADQVGYVHINDAVEAVDVDDQLDDRRRLPATTGLIDIAGFLKALDSIGYDGPVAVEPFDARLTRLAPAVRVRLAAESCQRAFISAGLSWKRD
jgi:sugar phosphate isomerase/epimerase